MHYLQCVLIRLGFFGEEIPDDVVDKRVRVCRTALTMMMMMMMMMMMRLPQGCPRGSSRTPRHEASPLFGDTSGSGKVTRGSGRLARDSESFLEARVVSPRFKAVSPKLGP